MSKERFNDWEIEHGLLNNQEIDGFKYWNFMRRDMFKSFEDEITEMEPVFYTNMKNSSKASLVDKIKQALMIFAPMPKIPKDHSDVMFVCHTRRQKIDGKFVSIYTDFVADHFPGSVTLQRLGYGKYKADEVYTKNLIYADRVSNLSYIYRYLMKYFRPGWYKSVKRMIRNEMAGPFKDLIENYGLHPDIDLFSERATVLYFMYRYRKKAFKKMLDKIKPKVIVEVVGGSFDTQIINEIAADRGIETIELQHGIGTTTVWFPKNARVKQYPKWYFTFGRSWSDTWQLPIPEDHLCPMGFPYHDILMKEFPIENWKHDKNAIIFLSSLKYGKMMSEVAVKLKELMPELRVIFKLHPVEYSIWRERYGTLKDSGVEVISDNSTSLYNLFSECSMQVGVESTAIYEGKSFLLETYIWDIPKAYCMRPLVESGHAQFFNDAEELAKLIQNRKMDTELKYSDDFWRHNALENIVSGIKAIKDGEIPKV